MSKDAKKISEAAQAARRELMDKRRKKVNFKYNGKSKHGAKDFVQEMKLEMAESLVKMGYGEIVK